MKAVSINILKASTGLVEALKEAGRPEHFPHGHSLFSVDDANDGVFLITRGKIRMSVKAQPRLDRVFGAGSLLGLPATFTGRPYSLTAIADSDCRAVHVPRDEFLLLMQSRVELCREATDMLCRETAFIETALAEQRRCALVAS